jgi:hypothetical protein
MTGDLNLEEEESAPASPSPASVIGASLLSFLDNDDE